MHKIDMWLFPHDYNMHEYNPPPITEMLKPTSSLNKVPDEAVW